MNVREQLAEALHRQTCSGDECRGFCEDDALVLAPLVEQIATERAASELEQAGDDWDLPGLMLAAKWLRDRAAVLRSQSHTDKGDQA